MVWLNRLVTFTVVVMAQSGKLIERPLGWATLGLIGRQIVLVRSASRDSGPVAREIVGIVGGVRRSALHEAPQPAVYRKRTVAADLLRPAGHLHFVAQYPRQSLGRERRASRVSRIVSHYLGSKLLIAVRAVTRPNDAIRKRLADYTGLVLSGYWAVGAVSREPVSLVDKRTKAEH